jgi:hypothetical protein
MWGFLSVLYCFVYASITSANLHTGLVYMNVLRNQSLPSMVQPATPEKTNKTPGLRRHIKRTNNTLNATSTLPDILPDTLPGTCLWG